MARRHGRNTDAMSRGGGASGALRAAGIAGLLVAALATEALGHARLVRSVPARHARLEAPPPRVELWFDELLDDGFNTVEVFPAAEAGRRGARRSFTRGAPAVDPGDRTRLTVDLEPLPPGEYAVEYRVLSRDGHTAPGRFTFRVGSGAE